MRRLAPVLAFVLFAVALLGPRPAAAQDRPAGGGSGTLAAWLTGVFDTSAQADADQQRGAVDLHDRVRLQISAPIITLRDATGGMYLYVEQAQFASLEKPYRQRVYRLSDRGESVMLEIWKIRDAARFAGGGVEPSRLSALRLDDLTHEPGCDVRLTRQGDRFTGGTEGKTCASTWNGSAYVVSQTTVMPDGQDTLDRGFDARDRQTFGPRDGGAYRFRRVRRPPNVVLVVGDDLGYGDTGPYGQVKIATPNLDRLAAEGIRFTDFYAGSTVCAPSRASLMTGLHTGHGSVRGNAGGADLTIQTLRPGDRTVAQLFKEAGYATGLFGKWGLGEAGSTGHPNRKGFDEMFGYLNQTHAHNYYPTFLFHNTERVPLRNIAAQEDPAIGHGYAKDRVEYAPDLILRQALQWIDANQSRPFFLFFATTLPHANNERTRATKNGMEIPDYGAYADRPWPDPDKGLAAMISRLDADVGALVARVEALGLTNDTVFIFTSDNGPHREGGNTPGFFASSGPLRGIKRDLYEGGIRVPLIVKWPGRVKAGQTSSHVAYFGDFFATFAAMAERAAPAGLDSISMTPTLLGGGTQATHDYLYWEFYENGSAQAVRFGSWKAVRKPMITGPIELYDLAADPGESRDVAAAHLREVERAAAFMDAAHTPDPRWVVK